MPALKAALMRTNGSHFSGSASSGKIASTGHSGSHAPQSMHSSGSMIRIRSNSWMQSTGQTSTHERSLMSMQGSAMMYVTPRSLLSARQLLDEVRSTLVESAFGENLVEAGGVRALQPRGIGVVREPENRHVGIGVGDLFRLDAPDVRDHEIGRVDAVARDQPMVGQQAFELPSEEDFDSRQQNRRHVLRRVTPPACAKERGRPC